MVLLRTHVDARAPTTNVATTASAERELVAPPRLPRRRDLVAHDHAPARRRRAARARRSACSRGRGSSALRLMAASPPGSPPPRRTRRNAASTVSRRDLDRRGPAGPRRARVANTSSLRRARRAGRRRARPARSPGTSRRRRSSASASFAGVGLDLDERARCRAPRAPRSSSIVPTNRICALVHDHRVVAHALDVGQQVRRQHDRAAAPLRQLDDQLEHLVARRADRGRWSARRGTASRDRGRAPARASRAASCRSSSRRSAGSASPRGRRSTAPRARAASPRCAAGPTARRRTCTARPRVMPGEERLLLRHVADAIADRRRRRVAADSPSTRRAALERDQPEQALEQRRLAGAVGAEQADDLAVDLRGRRRAARAIAP